MDSAPPPMAMSQSPSSRLCAAEMIACRPEPQRRLTLNAGVSLGIPAFIAATREIGISRFSGNDIAHHHMTDTLGGTTTALQGGADRSRGQFAWRGILERAAEGTDCSSDSADDIDFGVRHRRLRWH